MSTPQPHTPPELAHLNPPQAEAVQVVDRPVLVLAGAGSGKTRVITHKIAWLVHHIGLPPDAILALTFTNKAAGEMRSRAARMLGAAAERATIGTFHAVGLRILRVHARLIGREPGFVVYDAQDQEALLKRVLADLNVDPKVFRPRVVLHGIEAAKQRCQGPEAVTLAPPGSTAAIVARAYPLYEKRLREANAVDFGDLLWRVTTLFREHPAALAAYHYRWRHVLVDEFQDTNHAQYALLRQLVERPDGRLCGLTVVGDDDQSIYGWRGAHIGNILGFPKDFPDAHVVRLERNYRSTANILAAAGEVIAKNRRRHPKRLWTEAGPGSLVAVHRADTELDEAAWIVDRVRELHEGWRGGEPVPLSQIAVFYRTNAQSRPFEDALRRAGLGYQVLGGLRFYERKEVKDVLAYLRLLVNPADDVSFVRIVNVPRRGIGDTTVERLFERARDEGTSAWAALPAFAAEAKAAAGRRLRDFHQLVEDLRRRAATSNAVRTAVSVLEATQYLEQYEDDTVEAQTRRENVRELVNAIEVFCEQRPGATLADYLDEVSLVADVDTMKEGEDALTLMTVHSAKGLEFDAVFVAGLEEDLFPHANSVGDEDDVEEERRLFYVALTRARRDLAITLARQRRRYGELLDCTPSRFLGELPAAVLAPTPGSLGRRVPRLPLDDDWAPLPVVARPSAAARPAARAVRPAALGERRSAAVEPLDLVETVEYDAADGCDAPQTIEEAIGRRVRHPTFGEGRVTGARGDLVHVDFPAVGRKLIVGRYLVFLD
jgi:DNA helicase-2/ATP-dependent DNA helicase PcrA